MAITTAFCTSAKQELLQAKHDFTGGSPIAGDRFKVALIRVSAAGTYGAATANYSELNDSSPIDESTVGGGGSGYTLGGKLLDQTTPTTSGTTAFTDFADTVWTLSGASATLSADGCLIYNTTEASPSSFPVISVHAFSGSPEASGDTATFTIQWPTADASNAILRLA